MGTNRDAFMAHARTLSDKYSDARLSEADTRSYLIDPVLHLLGYDGHEHLRREVPVSATKEFIDYQLSVGGQPHILIEAKALRVDLVDQHAAQCVQYAAVSGVRWCFITNGIEWRLYDATAKGPLAKKHVATVKLDDTGASCIEAWRVLSLFARHEIERQTPMIGLLIQRVVEDELSDAGSPILDALRSGVQARFGEQVTSADVVLVARRLMRPNDAPSNSPRPQPSRDATYGTQSTNLIEPPSTNTSGLVAPPPYSKPIRFWIGTRSWQIKDWKDLPLKTCAFLAEVRPEKFKSVFVAEEFAGIKHRRLAPTMEGLGQPGVAVPGGFVDVGLSATDCVALTKRLLEFCGVDSTTAKYERQVGAPSGPS